MAWSISPLLLPNTASGAQLDKGPAVAVPSAEVDVDACWREEQNPFSDTMFLAIECSDTAGNEIGGSLRQRWFHLCEIEHNRALIADGQNGLSTLFKLKRGYHEHLVESWVLTTVHLNHPGNRKERREATSSWNHEHHTFV